MGHALLLFALIRILSLYVLIASYLIVPKYANTEKISTIVEIVEREFVRMESISIIVKNAGSDIASMEIASLDVRSVGRDYVFTREVNIDVKIAERGDVFTTEINTLAEPVDVFINDSISPAVYVSKKNKGALVLPNYHFT